jgi:LTXXQ motif family protein
MLWRKAVTLLAGAAVAALCVSAQTPALARPGGGGGGHGGGGGFHGGGGGFHGGGFHSGAFHAGGVRGGGFHGFAGHAIGGHRFAGHAVGGGHRFAGRAVGHAHNVVGHGVAHNGLAAHNAIDHDAVNHANADALHGAAGRNQMAAARFHGLHNFNRAGFNRNAFGNGHNWDRWGNRFWGAGWSSWGGGWGGWAGPVFWPYLYGDIFSFAFWPYAYYDPFWAFGPDFLLASIFAPGPYFGYDYGFGPGYYGYAGGSSDIYYGASRASRRQRDQTSVAAAQSCTGFAPGVTDLPIAQIKRTVHPTADQTTLLDDLNSAVSKADDAVKASCPTAIPLTPVARLETAQARIQAVIKAIDVVRGPLQKFYDSLSDEQQQRFAAMRNTRGSSAPAGGNIAALCSAQPGNVTDLPVQRIEQVVQPNGQQQDAFNALKKAADDAADQLKGSCPSEIPQAPVARLDAVKARLAAMVTAMNTVRPKLATFYASLSDDQKAKFNTMGPPQNAAAAPAQDNGQTGNE